MNKKLDKKRNIDFYLLYTLVFLAVALALYLKFFANGKSLVWSHDGVPQHLNSLAYYGKYLRKVLHTLFIEHKLSLPLWDMHIGYGSDILTTLHYYVIGDPLTLLSVFVPASKTEALYAFTSFCSAFCFRITIIFHISFSTILHLTDDCISASNNQRGCLSHFTTIFDICQEV